MPTTTGDCLAVKQGRGACGLDIRRAQEIRSHEELTRMTRAKMGLVVRQHIN